MKRVVIKVHGLVQGVGFRAYVYTIARRLGLKGFVKNLDDGSVLIIAEGPEEALEYLLEACRRGPPAAIIEAVEYRYENPSNKFQSFYIDYDP